MLIIIGLLGVMLGLANAIAGYFFSHHRCSRLMVEVVAYGTGMFTILAFHRLSVDFQIIMILITVIGAGAVFVFQIRDKNSHA